MKCHFCGKQIEFQISRGRRIAIDKKTGAFHRCLNEKKAKDFTHSLFEKKEILPYKDN